MIRKVLFLAAFALPGAAPRLFAAVEIIENPVYAAGPPTAIIISTSAYTKVPNSSTTTVAGRTAIIIDNPSTNSATVHGHIGNCTSTAVSITNVKGPLEIAAATNGGDIKLGTGLCLWIVSRHTSAETITFQEVAQRYAP